MTTSSASALLSSAAPAAAPAPGAAAPAASPAPAAPAPASNEPWFSGVQSPDLKTWIEAKGFKDPAAVAESAWNLEKLIGHEKAGRTLVLPKDDASPEDMRAFFTKLGVPEKPDGYNLPVPQGGDPEFSKKAAEWFHEAGVPPKQAAMLAEKFNAFVGESTTAQEAAHAANTQKEFGEVMAAWGKDADANVEVFKRAVAQFVPAGSDNERQELVNKIELAIGTKATMMLFANVGKGLGEHKVVDGSSSGGSFGMSPAAAQARIKALQSDTAWATRYINGGAAEKAEFAELFKVAYPGQQ